MSMNGIDVSNWQKGINLAMVPADFVIMKATEGIGYVSPDCDRQYQQAKKAGRCLGVYHYANGGNVQAEADFFLKNIKNYIGEAILVLDWEGVNNPRFQNNDVIWVKQWLDYVFKKTGVRPLLYVSQAEMSRFSGIGNYGLWIAQYANYERTGYQTTPWNEGAYACVIRQYSSSGRLSGYNANLDLNKAYMDKVTWSKYAAKNGATTSSAPTINSVSQTISESSLLDLVVAVMKDEYSSGNERKRKLGSRYNEVQTMINHIATSSVDVLVEEVYAGKYGDGEIRRIVLGNRYDQVQNRIDEGNSPNAIFYTVRYGDTLSKIASIYGTTYQKIASLNGLSNPNLLFPGQTLRIK